MIIWGARLTALEGFVYAWSRGMKGDFSAVMFNDTALWWDGTGIVYGPLFVIERWLVNAMPTVFTLELFWLANFLWVAIAFGCCLLATRRTGLVALLSLGLWLSCRVLYYSLSAAANPEFLELMFLSMSWLAASRAKMALTFVPVVLAALTKLIPAIFAPLVLLLGASRRAIIASATCALGLAAVVGFGQRMEPVDALAAVFVPFLYHPNGGAGPTALLRPVPSSFEVLGLSSALARLLGLADGDGGLPFVQTISNGVVAVLLIVAVAVTAALLRTRRVERASAVALSYGLFFALMPVATPNAHPHTFVFLLPVWIVLVSVLERDPDLRNRVLVGAFAAMTYVVIGVPGVFTVIDGLLGMALRGSAVVQDPIWANLALVGAMLVYASWRLASSGTAARR